MYYCLIDCLALLVLLITNHDVVLKKIARDEQEHRHMIGIDDGIHFADLHMAEDDADYGDAPGNVHKPDSRFRHLFFS